MIWLVGVSISGKTKTPCVLKILSDKIWISPVVNKFIASPIKKGFEIEFTIPIK